MVEPTRYEQNLFPEDIVEQTRSTKRIFELAMGGDLLLLIRLDAAVGELAWGLASSSGETAPMSSRPGGPQASRSTLLMRQIALAEHGSVPPPPSRRSLSSARLLGMVVRAPHFLVRLRKRPGAVTASQDRVTVGRARNNDVVLRHDTVSKFHAWFERSMDGGHQVGDAGSRNGTTINGTILPGTQRAPVEPGDLIRFGEVEVTVITPGALWDALSAGRAMTAR